MPPIPKKVSIQGVGGLDSIIRKPVEAGPTTPWEKGKVVLTLRDRDGSTTRKTLDAEVLGNWCLHHNAETTDLGLPKPGWTVTHVPTGLKVATVATAADAKRVAEVLHEATRNNSFFSQRVERGELVVRNLPPWVRPWVLACRKDRKYLDPKPYGG